MAAYVHRRKAIALGVDALHIQRLAVKVDILRLVPRSNVVFPVFRQRAQAVDGGDVFRSHAASALGGADSAFDGTVAQCFQLDGPAALRRLLKIDNLRVAGVTFGEGEADFLADAGWQRRIPQGLFAGIPQPAIGKAAISYVAHFGRVASAIVRRRCGGPVREQ